MFSRYLITGGAGFIGSALTRRLVAAGREVLVFDKLTYAGNLDSLRSVSPCANFRLVIGDIKDQSLIRQILDSFRPEIVLHLAAETHVDRSIDGPAEFIDTNIVWTFNLLRSCFEYWAALPRLARSNFRFHQVSTDEVYGSLGATGFFKETTAYAPNSPYSASKAAADHLARAWHHTYGLPTLISNCSNNYGPFQFPEKLIPLTIINALEGRPLPVYGDGSNVRDWLFVDDHVEALISIAERGQIGEVYNVGARAERSNLELVQQLCSLIDDVVPPLKPRQQLIRMVADRPGHDARYAIDPTKIENELGWRPRNSFDDGLRTTVRWYIENSWWWERIRSGFYAGERLGLAATAPAQAQV
jgi:dTDP-glucose 4,6-dehydratase